MKVFTIHDIRSWNPCYDPGVHADDSWKGNVLDLLVREDVTFENRLWVVMRPTLISEKAMRAFAIWCARQLQGSLKDKRSLNAIEVAEQFILGNCNKKDLATACKNAEDASDTSIPARAAWATTIPEADEAARSSSRIVISLVSEKSQLNKLIDILKSGPNNVF